jgi:hypothetical protein
MSSRYTPKAFGELIGRNGGKTMVYARVSIAAQKPDLAKQTAALKASCEAREIKVDEWMQDSGSGLNYKRKHFNRLMEMVELGQVRRITIAHRDRLVRSGYDYFEAFCERHNTQVRAQGSPCLLSREGIAFLVWAGDGENGSTFARPEKKNRVTFFFSCRGLDNQWPEPVASGMQEERARLANGRKRTGHLPKRRHTCARVPQLQTVRSLQ